MLVTERGAPPARERPGNQVRNNRGHWLMRQPLLGGLLLQPINI